MEHITHEIQTSNDPSEGFPHPSFSPSASVTSEPRCQSQHARLCPDRFPLVLRLQSLRGRRNSLLPPLNRTWKCDYGSGIFSGCGGVLLSRKCVARTPPFPSSPARPAVTVSISTSPAWIPSEPDPVTRPLVPEPDSCPRAAVRPPGYTLTCDLSPRVRGLGYRLQREKEHKAESFPSNTSQSPRGMDGLWNKADTMSIQKVSSAVFKVITSGSWQEVHIFLSTALGGKKDKKDAYIPNLLIN